MHFFHRISANAVDLEARQIAAACQQGGWSRPLPDLTGVAQKSLVNERLESARAHGIAIIDHHGDPTGDGGVELRVELARADDDVWLKLLWN